MKLPWSKPLALPPQLEWKYSHEPELMSWTIKSRNYNTFIANIMFLICLAMVIAGTSFIGFWFHENRKTDIPGSIGFFLIMTSVILSMTHQRMNFAYRISRSGFEYCGWKKFPKSAVIIVNCFAVIAVILIFAVMSSTPGGSLLGLVGAGGMGLTAIATINSKRFQKMHTEFFQVDFTWNEFDKISLYKSRHIIGLNHEWENLGQILPGIVNVFCRRKDFEERLAMIESLLPKPIPVVVEKFEVY
ncbi:hypothetical protein [Pseudomonas aeruginosa]|uniref:hypothetical protein n=4 Tax=Pseudomonas aeruginosa TaxID=287 RepID=UPI000D8F1DC3|nr:hypothetical protein [Pseudomonas aeruginosa]SQC51759.1 Uncharacterised protein [Pseudomonas aeruginosa]HBP1361344.1 hypothetical protein [Pseudomonas aeruginosa]HCU2052135.1 hypothetical protein [Pseudomonas aeruginosa]